MIHTTNRMVKILSYNAFRITLTILSGLLTPFLLVRDHDLSGLGYFSLAAAYATVIYIIFDFGLNTYYSRTSAKLSPLEQGEHLWGTILLRFGASLLAGSFIFSLTLLPDHIVQPIVKQLLLLYAIAAPLFMLQSLLSQAFVTLGYIKVQLQSELLNKFVYLTSLAIFSIYMNSLAQFLYPLIIAYFIQLLFLLSLTCKFLPFNLFTTTFMLLRKQFKEALQYYVFTLLSMLYGRIDILTLSFISKPTQVGIYALAYRGAELLAELGFNISNYFYRDLAEQGKLLLLKTNKFLLKLLTLLGLLGLSVSIMFSPLLKIPREDFIFPIFFMILCGGLMALNQITRSYLTLGTPMRVLEKFMLFTILLEFIAVLLLGFKYGGLGASIGVFLAELLLFTLLTRKAEINLSRLWLYPLPIFLLAVTGYQLESNVYLLGLTLTLFSILLTIFVINHLLKSIRELRIIVANSLVNQQNATTKLESAYTSLLVNARLMRSGLQKILAHFRG